ncbi:universal stress protein [Halorubrum ezzemoulense]|uniref:universal stress protein n=1 Tax=Halorubrum TaxID=56688 RepID=UPI000A2EBD88|nr:MULTISPECIES: universal stress protein [Halorubrum]MDB9248642.1 universal stress protein [Halorubrum ezzemoulense]MDB9259020.1 universal stress protein [Halorubrum ezzemoulense]MDB9262401.1 universal stress protein [Halorubrum ezzemoulense]MDB9266039.1 universal stress protein [Halorubrum ezzemoulense]MDB9269381.1 universal stress protein [Halorubrum ezzemoulense]
MYQTTLVPTGEGVAALDAVDDAIDVTAADGTVHVLGVVEEIPMYDRSGKPEKFDDDPERRDELEAAVDRVATAVADAGIDSETAVESGVPAHEIAAYADAVDADAVVMGKRGLDAAAGDLLGSTTERVIRNADATVVSVPVSE